jgi:hypothetical protein
MTTAALGVALAISERTMVARKSPVCMRRMRTSSKKVAAVTLYNPVAATLLLKPPWAFSLQDAMAPKNPPGPPMTLGNMRHLGNR